MYVFLLFLIGLGSFKCLFCGNVFYFYMIGVRVWFDYIYFDGKDSCICRFIFVIEVIKGFLFFIEIYCLLYLVFVFCFR